MYLPCYLLEAHDVLALSTKEGRQLDAIVAHKTRERTDVDIPAGVLPHRLRLHLRQTVERGEAAVAQVVCQQLVVGMTTEREGTEQRHKNKKSLVHRCKFTHYLPNCHHFLHLLPHLFPFVMPSAPFVTHNPCFVKMWYSSVLSTVLFS